MNVLTALRTLGFSPEGFEDLGYSFDYEGLTLIFSDDVDDAKCITFVVPNVYEISDDNRSHALESLIKLCCTTKYVQPHIVFNNQIWLNYQHYVGDSEVTPELIEHIIRGLAFSTTKFHNILNGKDNDN